VKEPEKYNFKKIMLVEFIQTLINLSVRRPEIALLHTFLKRVEESMAQDEEDDEAYGDIPDEFLDPLKCFLMKDPVLLPTSGTIVLSQHYYPAFVE
jgi:hypothetical protein